MNGVVAVYANPMVPYFTNVLQLRMSDFLQSEFIYRHRHPIFICIGGHNLQQADTVPCLRTIQLMATLFWEIG